MTKVVRIQTAVETNDEVVRLVFRQVNAFDPAELVWNFSAYDDYAHQQYFHGFTVSLASFIAKAMIELNPAHCSKQLTHLKSILEQDKESELLERYNSMNTDWSRMTILVMERIKFCREAVKFETQDEEVHKMIADLKYYYASLSPSIISGLYDQLKLMGVDLTAFKEPSK